MQIAEGDYLSHYLPDYLSRWLPDYLSHYLPESEGEGFSGGYALAPALGGEGGVPQRIVYIVFARKQQCTGELSNWL